MKRVVLFSSLFLVLFLTGCGNTKRVVCSQTVMSIVDVDMIMDFEDDYLKEMGFTYTMDLTSLADDQIEEVKKEDLCSSVKESMPQYKDAFRNCKQSIDGKKLLVEAEFDVNKIPGIESKENNTLEASVKALESQGYTCKQ